MHRYGTKGRSAETWRDYARFADCENSSKEFHRKFRSRARQNNKKFIEEQLEDWRLDTFWYFECFDFCSCELCRD